MSEASLAIVRAEYLPALAPLISADDNRPSLGGILIEPHPRAGTVLVASDGAMLGAIHDASAVLSGPPLIWSGEWKKLAAPIKQFRKANRHATVWCRLSRDTDDGRIAAELLTADSALAALQTDAADEIEVGLRATGRGGALATWRTTLDECTDEQPVRWLRGDSLARAVAFAEAVHAACGVVSRFTPGTRLAVLRAGESCALVRIYGQEHAVLLIAGGEVEDLPLGAPDWLNDAAPLGISVPGGAPGDELAALQADIDAA